MCSQRRGRRCRRRSGAVGNTLAVITQTYQITRTGHTLNARHRNAACNASIMPANPRLTYHFPCTTHAPAVWMGRTCKQSRDGAPCCQYACKQDRANGCRMPSSDRSPPNATGSGPGRTRFHFHCTHLSPFQSSSPRVLRFENAANFESILSVFMEKTFKRSPTEICSRQPLIPK